MTESEPNRKGIGAMTEYWLRISRIEWMGWLPKLMDEGSELPGHHDYPTTSYKAWGWLWFRFSKIVHSGHTTC